MNATLPSEYVDNGRNYSGEKELLESYTLVGIGKSRSDVDALAKLRIYSGRSRNASRIYASLWVYNRHGEHAGCAGHGWAGGWGYHKASAAAAEAFRSAGIKLDENIAGAGESAIEDALKAVGIALGYDTVRIFSA